MKVFLHFKSYLPLFYFKKLDLGKVTFGAVLKSNFGSGHSSAPPLSSVSHPAVSCLQSPSLRPNPTCQRSHLLASIPYHLSTQARLSVAPPPTCFAPTQFGHHGAAATPLPPAASPSSSPTPFYFPSN
jgi:hypothetical protein